MVERLRPGATDYAAHRVVGGKSESEEKSFRQDVLPCESSLDCPENQ